MSIAQHAIKFMKNKRGLDKTIMQKLNITSAENGCVSAVFKVDEDNCNSEGHLHGGFAATLVDLMTSLSLITVLNKKAHVTVTLNVEFVKPARLEDEVTIDTTIIKQGKTLAFTEAYFKSKKTGELLIKGNHVKFILDSTFL